MSLIILVIFAVVNTIALVLTIKWKFFRQEPKIDGHLVITHNDGKTTMSFEFDDGDQMVELRNKQRVVFEVVGPDTVVFEDEDTPS